MIIVILDHLGFGWCAGGFVGVDVFFVIAGYVITQHIAKEAANGTFLMAGFYERRIRRLLPGLAAVTVLVVAAAWRIMLPEDLKSLTGSVASAGLAVSNVFFWRQSGYFDELSITKPMLHTWSLGVEEQFYLFFPLLFTRLYKARRKVLLPTLSLLTFVSLTWATFRTFHHSAETFFLLPSRLWEMLIGGLVFLAFNSFKPSKFVGLLLSCGGLGLIFIAATVYSNRTPFPGLTALLPTLGAIGFILGGQSERASVTFRIITWPPILYIGKISYLLYLTHWPIIVFWTYYKISTLSLLDKLLIIIASMMLSGALYSFVEQPFRSKAILPKRWHAYALAAFFVTLCCVVVCGGHLKKGFPGRFERQLAASLNIRKELSENDNVMNGVIPIVGGRRLDHGHVDPKAVATFGGDGPADIAVFGDSHAAHLFDGFVSEAQMRRHRVKFFVNYCSPPALNLSSWNEGGVQYNDEVVSLLCKDDTIKVVLLAANWTMYLKGGSCLGNQSHLLQLNGEDVPVTKALATMRQQVTRTLEKIHSHGKRVYILEPVPDYKLDVANTLQRCAIAGHDVYDFIDTSRNAYLSRHAATIEMLKRAAVDSESTVIPSADAFWNGTRFMVEKNGTSLYSDHHHLSSFGSRLLAPFIFDRIYPEEKRN